MFWLNTYMTICYFKSWSIYHIHFRLPLYLNLCGYHYTNKQCTSRYCTLPRREVVVLGAPTDGLDVKIIYTV